MEYSVYELSIKWRSKNEFYNVLARDGNIYLPPLHEATQKYLRAIMNGDKKYLKCNRVSVIKVPHYTRLTANDSTFVPVRVASSSTSSSSAILFY